MVCKGCSLVLVWHVGWVRFTAAINASHAGVKKRQAPTGDKVR